MFTLPLILASQSPRRRSLLSEAGFEFSVLPPDDDVEDAPAANESPLDYVKRLAIRKAENVLDKIDRGIVIACDTVAVCRNEILGKPENRADAARMLRLLSDELHQVYSGLCVSTKPADFHVVESETSVLRMKPLSEEELERYLDSGAWQGKAGAFGLQDRTGWIELVSGSETNVVGLPMELLKQILGKFPGKAVDISPLPLGEG